MCWVNIFLISLRGASNEYHNVCFHGEIRKISILLSWKGILSKAMNISPRLKVSCGYSLDVFWQCTFNDKTTIYIFMEIQEKQSTIYIYIYIFMLNNMLQLELCLYFSTIKREIFPLYLCCRRTSKSHCHLMNIEWTWRCCQSSDVS